MLPLAPEPEPKRETRTLVKTAELAPDFRACLSQENTLKSGFLLGNSGKLSKPASAWPAEALCGLRAKGCREASANWLASADNVAAGAAEHGVDCWRSFPFSSVLMKVAASSVEWLDEPSGSVGSFLRHREEL